MDGQTKDKPKVSSGVNTGRRLLKLSNFDVAKFKCLQYLYYSHFEKCFIHTCYIKPSC